MNPSWWSGTYPGPSARGKRDPLTHDALVIDVALMATPARGIGARFEGIASTWWIAVYVCLPQLISPRA
jgi:hypothetical protein